jgi:hypothetical protein
MRIVGRRLQQLGLLIPPISVVVQLIANSRGQTSVSPMLLLLGFAVCVFMIGRIIEGYGQRA